MTNDNEIAKIVAGLSEAQKFAFQRSLLAPLSNGVSGVWKGLVQKTDVVWPTDCVEYLTCGTPGYQKLRLTPLGLAVRDALQREK